MPIAEARRHKRKHLGRDEWLRARDARLARIVGAAAGLFVIARGWSALTRGEEGWMNYHHEFVWAIVAIVSGVVVFLASVTSRFVIARISAGWREEDEPTSEPPRLRG